MFKSSFKFSKLVLFVMLLRPIDKVNATEKESEKLKIAT